MKNVLERVPAAGVTTLVFTVDGASTRRSLP
ncbi:hypothetical protein O9929_14745 [Vibrio lentus]|nr:hypothetical protein [Vibrio lentus]